MACCDGLDIPTAVAMPVSQINSPVFAVHFATHTVVLTGILAISLIRLLSVPAL